MTLKGAVKRSAAMIGLDIGSLRRTVRRNARRLRHRGGARASWYDKAYGESSEYSLHYTESVYLPIWEEIVQRVSPGASVLEIGCGSGQLAEMLIDRHDVRYTGFDFSERAISMARGRQTAGRFEVDDARTSALVHEPADAVICTEVLEHIHGDLEVLGRIPSGRRVLATVPDFESETHVRWFDSEESVSQRYRSFFEGLEVQTFTIPGVGGRFFLMDGVRASGHPDDVTV